MKMRIGWLAAAGILGAMAIVATPAGASGIDHVIIKPIEQTMFHPVDKVGAHFAQLFGNGDGGSSIIHRGDGGSAHILAITGDGGSAVIKSIGEAGEIVNASSRRKGGIDRMDGQSGGIITAKHYDRPAPFGSDHGRGRIDQDSVSALLPINDEEPRRAFPDNDEGPRGAKTPSAGGASDYHPII